MWIARLIETRKYFSVFIDWVKVSIEISLVLVSLILVNFGPIGTLIQIVCLIVFITLESRSIGAVLKKVRISFCGRRKNKKD